MNSKLFGSLQLLTLACGLFAGAAVAETTTLAGSPYALALRDGKATSSPPPNALTTMAIKKIQEKTGSNGQVILVAFRIVRFKGQPKCGRVAFGLLQESTHTFWGQFGGQLNVCEDGTPPLRVCKAKPSQLVLPDHECADKTHPVDAPEVADAVAKAVAGGSLTIEQFRNSMMRKPAQPTSGAAK